MMSETKFTSGEWIILKHSSYIDIGVGKKFINEGMLEEKVCMGVSFNQVANAHLISQAPAMYAMIETLIENYRLANEVLVSEGYESRFDQDSELVNLLLAKCRGE